MLPSSFNHVPARQSSFDCAAAAPLSAAMAASSPAYAAKHAPRPLPLVVALPLIAGMSLTLWAGVGRLLSALISG